MIKTAIKNQKKIAETLFALQIMPENKHDKNPNSANKYTYPYWPDYYNHKNQGVQRTSAYASNGMANDNYTQVDISGAISSLSLHDSLFCFYFHANKMEFFKISKSDAFLSDYLTDLKLQNKINFIKNFHCR